jgi:DNA-binding transcriptional ArsR family regulator
MPLPATIEQPVREKLRISLEPAQNAFASMLLLANNEEMPGLSPWISQTRATLTANELFRHRLVIIGFYFAIIPEMGWTSFSDYLDALDKTAPSLLVDKLLSAYTKICCPQNVKNAKQEVNWVEILSSAEEYVKFLSEDYDEGKIEVDIETKAYEYVIDPPALKDLVTQHLRWFWDEHLADEWARTEPILKESVKAFQSANLNNISNLEFARYITGQDLDETTWQEKLERADAITFIPNAHIGPYIHKVHSEKSLTFVFGARQPEDASVRIPELDRADIVTRMSALADDTRLRILQMIGESGELRSQDIIDEVGLSQPSISRYLKQLTATGYLQERRVNGSKAYALNRDRIEKTLKAVHKFLLGS